MRVLHIFNEIKFSGAEIMYANAAPIFQRSGIEMIAFSTGKEVGEFSKQFELANISVHHKPLLNGTFNPFFLFRYFKDVYIFIRREKIDVVHIHRSSYFWFFSLLTFLMKRKGIRTVHSVFRNRSITWPKAVVERFTARKLFGITFQTIGKSVYDNELKYYWNPTVRVNNWYNNSKFFPSNDEFEKVEIRKRLNINEDCFVIISTGGCTHGKNHHDIIRALTIIKSKVKCMYIHLGQGHTELEEVELSKKLNVYDSIRFLGNRENVRDFLIASDIYVMPSRFEGLSIASIEAMACGLPSILYDSPGLRDLIDEDNNGFLIRPDYRELAQKILFLHDNPEVSMKMGYNANLFVNKYFSMNDSVNKIISLYNS